MKNFFLYLMIYAGSALMAYNIYRYVCFSRDVRKHGNWDQEQRLFNLPILLLILFFIGYLIVGVFGKPDLVMAGILFGGSIFVFVMLLLIRRTFDRIQENEQLEVRLSAAEEASKAKTFFLSNMSHDIRTPLNAIIGYTTLANRENVAYEDKSAYISKIEMASRQLLEIVNDVLDMSRIESGKFSLEPTSVNLESCIHEVRDLVRTQLEAKRINFSVSCLVSHKWVLCDRVMLDRALMNLLCNAGKFTEENGSVSLQLNELAGDDETARYEIRIKDTGIGMSREFAERLFIPFERERTSTVSKIQGTGLGLAITKSIVDMMGGIITVQTEKGKGTEFNVTVGFPLAEPKEETCSSEGDDISFEGIRALLVEDNMVNMEIATMLLEQSGFLIETAENGEIALEMTAASEPGYYDVILMDIQMPVMDGYTATQAIRNLPNPKLAGIPIIAMTANAFQEDIKKAEEVGMNGHIAKPLDIPSMKATLRQVLKIASR
ncbi:MAG: response regulator [Anaerolineaceae bacterium]|nr:response regulator [Anaerolineaceae bacterium]